jgi:predicted metalloprotease
MPRRLIGAFFALILPFTISASVAAMPTETAPGDESIEARFQEEGATEWVPVEEQAIVEDEFSAFTMPGMTADNLTASVLADIDAYWAGEFAANGDDYYAASNVPVSDVVYSSCGQFGPYDNPAAFCPLDDTVYYSVPLSQEIHTNVGDFAWITVLAHEWGHHVQLLLGIEPELTIDRELQADCFAGAYAQRALQQGFLQEGDVTEAMVINIMSGDPIEMEEMADGAHGSSDYRVTSFMEGYFGGSSACLAH